MAELVDAGADRVVALVLTPHRSSLGSGEYIRRAEEAAALAPCPVTLISVPSWHRAPGLAELLAERTEAALASIDARDRTRTAVFFTAHSLPERALVDGDPYPEQVRESASDIAGLLGLDDFPGVSWGVAWQSAGRTPDPWFGPDLLTEIRRVAAEGATSVVVCPVGFVSDHLEVLYDLDIEASGVARSAGVGFARTSSLNDDPRFLDILAGVVRRAVDHRRRGPGTAPEDRSARDPSGGTAVATTGPAPPGVTERRPTIAVVGAGIAGLAAAWELVVASERDALPPHRPRARVGRSDRRQAPGRRVRRPDRRPGRRRIPRPPARGHRAVRRARTVRATGSGGSLRRLHLGPGPAPGHARRAEPRGPHPLVAAVRSGILSPAESLAWPGTWSPPIGRGRGSSVTGRRVRSSGNASDARWSSGWWTR